MDVRSVKQALDAAVEAARWAPSVHNTQPWIFKVTGTEIDLKADVDRQLRVSDPSGRELVISCGAALFTIRTVMRCQGYEPAVRLLPDPDRPSLLATVKAGTPIEADEQIRALGGEVERRRTHRAGFADVPVPGHLIESLGRKAAAEGVRLTPVVHPAAATVVAALTQAAQGVQSQDQRFTLELLRWSRAPESTREDGVPAGAYPRHAAPTDPHFPQRDYSWRHAWGAEGGQGRALGALVLLTTDGDGREEWIAAGQALQHVLLYAAAHGVSAAFHTQALEKPHLREFLREELCGGAYPQVIMRLGVAADDVKRAARRPLSEVLEE
ncbi:nitroreductase family protein [Nonomuraea sp. B12E4]|uniref:Acg family FMN-binding oxidoreductase n=1 Tax=Nonomuraea sp. B12E4 TaxID=3153564 RepID=UPI00325D8389